MDSSIISRYFPGLTELQRIQFEALGVLYPDWNEKINVISRKDIENLYVNHVLHSLAIAEFITPVAGTRFMDLGTGGGFPGIPLAIMFPDCTFHLIDRIGKKLREAQNPTLKPRRVSCLWRGGQKETPTGLGSATCRGAGMVQAQVQRQ